MSRRKVSVPFLFCFGGEPVVDAIKGFLRPDGVLVRVEAFAGFFV
jgi:hypothetical protein